MLDGAGARLAQRRGPQEHEDVHGGLEQRLRRAQHEDLAVVADAADRRLERTVDVDAGVAVILVPRRRDDDEGDGQQHGGDVERADGAEEVVRRVGDDAGGDGDDAVARGRLRERHRQVVGREPAAVMLLHHPGLERREQDRGGDPAQQPADQQPRQRAAVLDQAAERVQDAEQLAGRLPAAARRHPRKAQRTGQRERLPRTICRRWTR